MVYFQILSEIEWCSWGILRACGARIRLVEGATAPTRRFFYGVLEGDKLNLFSTKLGTKYRIRLVFARENRCVRERLAYEFTELSKLATVEGAIPLRSNRFLPRSTDS